MPDVVLLGDVNVDMIATLPAYPARGSAGVANSVEYYTGGSVVNTALALKSLDVGTGIVGRIGNDMMAQKILMDLDQAGVDRSQVQIDEIVRTGTIYIVVNPDGERTMFSARGANVFTEPTDSLEQYFQDTRWYHFSGYTLLAEPQQSAAIHGLELARRNRCRVSLDPGTEPAMYCSKQIRDLLPRVDVFLPNESELGFLAGRMDLEEALQDVLTSGVRAVVLKRGSRGCIVAYDKTRIAVPSFEIQVKDTTGAGDTFDAGILLGRMVGLSWTAAAILGNAMAAIACSSPGTGADEITAAKIIELIERDSFKPRWEEFYASLDVVLAYLTAL